MPHTLSDISDARALSKGVGAELWRGAKVATWTRAPSCPECVHACHRACKRDQGRKRGHRCGRAVCWAAPPCARARKGGAGVCRSLSGRSPTRVCTVSRAAAPPGQGAAGGDALARAGPPCGAPGRGGSLSWPWPSLLAAGKRPMPHGQHHAGRAHARSHTAPRPLDARTSLCSAGCTRRKRRRRPGLQPARGGRHHPPPPAARSSPTAALSVLTVAPPLAPAGSHFAMGKCGKGTGSFGLRHTKSHTLCRRCGRRSFHIQKSTCSSCGYPAAKIRKCECGGGAGAAATGFGGASWGMEHAAGRGRWLAGRLAARRCSVQCAAASAERGLHGTAARSGTSSGRDEQQRQQRAPARCLRTAEHAAGWSAARRRAGERNGGAAWRSLHSRGETAAEAHPAAWQPTRGACSRRRACVAHVLTAAAAAA